MKKTIIVLFAVMLLLSACSTHTHVVGNGPSKGETVQARQWYILWGLIPLNNVDTNAMAADATNYEIQTQTSVLDVIIGIPASYITVCSRTVKVTK